VKIRELLEGIGVVNIYLGIDQKRLATNQGGDSLVRQRLTKRENS
jgi:hypothetical protein